MKTARLQAAFARKREAEHIRIERTQETNRYFDHWGKVTSRFQNWTTPEYYQNAEKSVKEQKEKQIKEEKLNERRDKLKKLLENENQQYENELQSIILRKQSPSVMLSGRRSKYDSVDTNLLEKIKENRSDEMRRLELEAKLYQKWRNPVSGVTLSTTPLAIISSNEYSKEKSLFESKSDNEIMAKLNWLDKQIENQMRREEEEKEVQQRNLKLQQEARKCEEIQRERHLIRESEIKELRALQENHVTALNQRELESIQLQQDEQHYHHTLETIATELNDLKLNHENYLKTIETNLPHNIKKIKILFRQLSDENNEHFQKDIECLNRIKLLYSYAQTDNQLKNDNNNNNMNNSDQIRLATIQELIEKFQYQFKYENLNQSDICNMYESEAKTNFKKWHELWCKQEILRKTKIIELLKRDQIYYDAKLNENLKQQKLIIEIRETHLAAIENSNEKLNMLINSQKILKNDNDNEIHHNINDNVNDNNNNNNNNNNNRNTKSNIFWDNYGGTSTSDLNQKNNRNTDYNTSRNASRSSSRNSFNLNNSHRSASTNSAQNTKSRIFGWMDEENNNDDDLQKHLNEKTNFGRRKFISNDSINTAIGIKTMNATKSRENLINNIREGNSRPLINNHNHNKDKLSDADNNKNRNTASAVGPEMKISINNSNNEQIDSTCKKLENSCNIINEKNLVNLNNYIVPKFGKKKVAWN